MVLYRGRDARLRLLAFPMRSSWISTKSRQRVFVSMSRLFEGVGIGLFDGVPGTGSGVL